jgi:hypothetical protein
LVSRALPDDIMADTALTPKRLEKVWVFSGCPVLADLGSANIAYKRRAVQVWPRGATADEIVKALLRPPLRANENR